MHALNCPHHGTQVLEYLRGRLDNAAALAAEDHLESCPHCSAWYEKAFSGAAFDTVDRAVQASLDKVSLPRRNRHMRWVAAAAAITLVVTGYGWWQHSNPIALHPDPVVSNTVESQPTIASLDFEEGVQIVNDGVLVVEDIDEVAAEMPVEHDDEVLFASDLDDGDLGSWEFHT